nr:hypothetical protein [uncultured Carboxylicivirga sp.]
MLLVPNKIHIHTQWQTSDITIDGNSDDWNIPLRFFDSKNRLNYNITNNSEGIFFAFRMNEMSYIHQFNQNGITIELDTTKSNNTALILQYPAGGIPPIPPSNTQNSNRDNMPIPESSIRLNGFYNYKKEVVLALEEVKGIKAAHSFDMVNESLFCEIFIPYSSINSNAKTIQSSNSELNIKLLLGTNNNSMPGPPPGGMHGGGRPDGPTGAPPTINGNSQTKETKIKLEVHLAKQPTK